MPKKSFTDQITLPLSYTMATIYWFNCQNSSAPAILAKTISTALLALHSYNTAVSHLTHHAAVTMGLHCAGDLLIELPGDSILLALAAFFLGHCGYFSLLQKNRVPLAEISFSKKTMLGAFGIFAAAFTNLLISKTSGVIQCAIPFYSFVLSSVFIVACLQAKNSHRTTVGAAAYVASDMLIATNMFLEKIPGASRVTWPLYFLAQNFLRCTYQKSDPLIYENEPAHSR